jgi:hypothetical protein
MNIVRTWAMPNSDTFTVPPMGQLPKIGQRVILTGGGWAGFTGEYEGVEQTLTGPLYRVKLDNGVASLVAALQMRIVEEE